MATSASFGTYTEGGIDHHTYPPPMILVKAMERRWATLLVSEGSIQFGNLGTYRAWENEALGDPHDGKGMFRMKGHPYQMGSANPLYAWCSSLPDITPERLLVLAHHGKYDCLVRLHQPTVLLQRLRAALLRPNQKLLLHCGDVAYDRGAEVDKETLNTQQFLFNAFQKSSRFALDREYRLVLVDAHLRAEPMSHITMSIGDCSDIMDIQGLPNRT